MPQPAQVRQLRRQVGDGYLAFVRADLFEFETAWRFDAVLLSGVLHYLGSLERVRDLLGRIVGWLKPQGIAALSWITPDIPLTHAEAYLPPQTLVVERMRELGLRRTVSWEVEIRHSHDHFPCHQHRLVYSCWFR